MVCSRPVRGVEIDSDRDSGSQVCIHEPGASEAVTIAPRGKSSAGSHTSVEPVTA
ncbi:MULTISPECIES: hypothetical protein [unclassified Actinomadura]|uniref:hypothetical protein n=1 Tax=unclassified Actinomadura TaxID=2626254 RepID=UPI00135C83AF|nr:hypothetical protein [Actinomadura sp. K4S16]